MKSRIAPWVVLVALVLPLPGVAQTSSPAAAPGKEARIRELLVLTGTGALGTQVMTRMLDSFRKSLPDVPAEFWDDFQGQVHPEELEAMIVPIYEKHFDESEIDGMLAFYRTALGKKVIRELPGIMNESFSAGQEWGQSIARKAIEQLKKKGYKIGA